jgi:ABC-type nitrate/sulfonate/bicarbonate transport system substrate-binding protein
MIPTDAWQQHNEEQGMASNRTTPSEAMQHAAATASPSRRTLLAGLGAAVFAPALRAQSSLKDIAIPISSTSFATASVRSAELLGCFTRHGLNAKFPVLGTGPTLSAALVSGSAQVVVGGAGEQVAAWVRGQRVLTLTNVYWGLAASIVLAKDVAERTGVSLTAPVRDRLKALDGLLIAVPSATSTYTNSFRGAAEAVGAKMRLTYMDQPAMVASLEAGAVQGYSAGAPFWGAQVARGKAVVWVSGPKGELPTINTPASITTFQAMAPVAEANPVLMRQVIDSYRDFSDILESAPDKVRGALGKLYPDVDPATMDVLFAAEQGAWKYRQVTPAHMKQDIDFMRASGVPLPGIEKLDPAAMIYMPR